MLGVTALATSFIGNETPIALTAASIIGFGIVTTMISSYRIMSIVRNLSPPESYSTDPTEASSPTQKCSSQSDEPPMTPLTSLNATAALPSGRQLSA